MQASKSCNLSQMLQKYIKCFLHIKHTLKQGLLEFLGISGVSWGLWVKSGRVPWRPLIKIVRVLMSLLDIHEFPRVPATVSKFRFYRKQA